MMTRWQFSLILLVIVFNVGCQQSTPDSEVASRGEASQVDQSSNVDPWEGMASTPTDAELSSEQIQQGWLELFDGETLFGWQTTTPNAWSTQQGCLQGQADQSVTLLSSVRYPKFELSFDVVTLENSECELILQSTSDADVDFEFPLSADSSWHHCSLSLSENSITFQLADADPITSQLKDEQSFHIGIDLNHGGVRMTNLQLKPLNMASLFNGTDLTGWREVPGSKSEFKVVDSEIRVTNGLGFWETEQTYDNFLFQMEAKTHAPELNSGLFFRAMAGTEQAPSHGYEMQIHNGIKDGDPKQPANGGTGGIFRRVNAREVVSQDGQWCTMTLIADGPQIATWVNGVQVVDWKDERQPHENPRKGLRLKAGHFSLQGHDPTTDLSFRNLRVAAFDHLESSEE